MIVLLLDLNTFYFFRKSNTFEQPEVEAEGGKESKYKNFHFIYEYMFDFCWHFNP